MPYPVSTWRVSIFTFPQTSTSKIAYSISKGYKFYTNSSPFPPCTSTALQWRSHHFIHKQQTLSSSWMPRAYNKHPENTKIWTEEIRKIPRPAPLPISRLKLVSHVSVLWRRRIQDRRTKHKTRKAKQRKQEAIQSIPPALSQPRTPTGTIHHRKEGGS